MIPPGVTYFYSCRVNFFKLIYINSFCTVFYFTDFRYTK
nr:MAG TPA: hypothetical protein [Caudoviricetes sp.]